MVAPLSDVPQEGSSVFSLFSLIKLHLASLPLVNSYSRVAVSSVFWAQNIFFRPKLVGPVKVHNKIGLLLYTVIIVHRPLYNKGFTFNGFRRSNQSRLFKNTLISSWKVLRGLINVFVIAQEFWHYFLLCYRTESDNSRQRRTPKHHTLILLGTPFHVSTLLFQLMDQPTRY